MNAMLTVGLLLAWTIAAAPIQGTAPADDYASIDAWIDAGAWDRAEEALRHAALPPSARARLQGKLALQRGDYERASEAFTTALAAAPDDATLRLYLARALLELGRAAEALAALDGTASWARRSVAQPLLHARALTLLGRDGEAYAVLREAAERFPNDPAPRLELVVSCARLELFDTALAWARTLPTTSLDVARAIVVALHRHGAALPLLEQIVAQHPRAVDLVVALAHGYAAQGHPAAAARLFARATALGDDQVHAAADQLRLAGDHRAALTMNARVADPAARVRQRLAIAFEAGDMARVVALAPSLREHGVDTPSDRYRVAYAYYVLGQHAQATSWARALEGTSEQARARSLLAAMGRAPASSESP